MPPVSGTTCSNPIVLVQLVPVSPVQPVPVSIALVQPVPVPGALILPASAPTVPV